jgi:hypothetical protein
MKPAMTWKEHRKLWHSLMAATNVVEGVGEEIWIDGK